MAWIEFDVMNVRNNKKKIEQFEIHVPIFFRTSDSISP